MTNPVFFTGDMEILNETLGGDAFPVICALTRYAETGVEADIDSFYQGQRIAYLLLKQKVEISLQKNGDAAAARKNHARKAAKARWEQVREKEKGIGKADGDDLKGTEIVCNAKAVQDLDSLFHDVDTVQTGADVSADAYDDLTDMGIPGDAENSQTCTDISEDAGNARTCTGRSEDAGNAETCTVSLSKEADRACLSIPRDAENAETCTVSLPKEADRACLSNPGDAENAQTDTDSSSSYSSRSLFNSYMDIQDKDIQDKDTDNTDSILYKSLYKTNACAREGEADQWGHLGDEVSEEELEALRQQRTTEIPAIEQLMRDCGAVFAPADEDIARELLAEYSCETILRAIHEAKEGGKVNWRYIRGILKNWKESEQRVGGRNSGNGRGPAGSGETSGGAGKGSGNRPDPTGRTETSKHSDDLPEAARRYLQSILV